MLGNPSLRTSFVGATIYILCFWKKRKISFLRYFATLNMTAKGAYVVRSGSSVQ